MTPVYEQKALHEAVTFDREADWDSGPKCWGGSKSVHGLWTRTFFMVRKRHSAAYPLWILDYARGAYAVHRIGGQFELVAVTGDER
jgi:hypothetical protein